MEKIRFLRYTLKSDYVKQLDTYVIREYTVKGPSTHFARTDNELILVYPITTFRRLVLIFASSDPWYNNSPDEYEFTGTNEDLEKAGIASRQMLL